MLTIPTDLARAYESLLANHSVPAPQWPYYLKWLRYYPDFDYGDSLPNIP